MMFVTLVAVLCSSLAGPPLCVEEIVTDSSMSDINWMECQVHGQIGVIQFMENSVKYHEHWTVESYRCVPGRYEIRSRA